MALVKGDFLKQLGTIVSKHYSTWMNYSMHLLGTMMRVWLKINFGGSVQRDTSTSAMVWLSQQKAISGYAENTSTGSIPCWFLVFSWDLLKQKIQQQVKLNLQIYDWQTCKNGTCGEKHKVDRNHLCGIKHFHCLIEKSVERDEKFWCAINKMTLVKKALCNSLFIHHNTVGALQVQCHHVQYITFSSVCSGIGFLLVVNIRDFSNKKEPGRENKKVHMNRERKPWLTWSGRHRRQPWRQPLRRRWGRWVVAGLLLTLWSSLTQLWLRWLSERLQKHRRQITSVFSCTTWSNEELPNWFMLICGSSWLSLSELYWIIFFHRALLSF